MSKDNFKKEKTTNKAIDALNRLSKGKNTINEVRVEFGLKKSNADGADENILKD